MNLPGLPGGGIRHKAFRPAELPPGLASPASNVLRTLSHSQTETPKVPLRAAAARNKTTRGTTNERHEDTDALRDGWMCREKKNQGEHFGLKPKGRESACCRLRDKTARWYGGCHSGSTCRILLLASFGTVGVLPQGRAIRSPGAQKHGNPWKTKIGRVENQGKHEENQGKPRKTKENLRSLGYPRPALRDLVCVHKL